MVGEDLLGVVGLSHVCLSLDPFFFSFLLMPHRFAPKRQLQVHSGDFLRMAVLYKEVGSCGGLQIPASVSLFTFPEEEFRGEKIVE